jgi:alpha-L-fucosidase
VWELWWDGANGEGPNGKKQVYDFKRFEETVRMLSPNTVIFSDVCPDIRWVGNEQGFAGETNWNTLNIKGF